jgi:hypothetical protein
MNKELQEFEAELQSLRPRQPSVRLLARIEADLKPKRGMLLAWAGLPLAAAIVMMFVLSSKNMDKPVVRETPVAITPDPAVAVEPDIFKPIATQNVLYATQDEGIVTLTDGRKARRVNRAYVDTVLWRNPQTNASLTWSVPRNEVQVTPVAFQ